MKIVILGGVAAGAKAAAKSRRLLPDAEIDIYTEDTHVSYSACGLPYYIEGNFEDYRMLLVRSPEEFEEKNIHVHLENRAIKILPESKQVLILDMVHNNAFLVNYDKLIISTGSRPIIPNIINSKLKNIFTLKRIEDGIAIKEIALKSKHVTIIGGGYIGLELLEAFVKQGLKVTIFEYAPTIMPRFDDDMAILIKDYLTSISEGRFEILNREVVTEFIGDENGEVTAVKTTSGINQKTDFVVISTGAVPNVELARDAGIILGQTGAIHVSEKMETNIPDIYACGDCVEETSMFGNYKIWTPLGAVANKQGRVAAMNVCGFEDKFHGVLNSSVSRCLSLTMSRTGFSEKGARREGIEPVSAIVTKSDKVGYMPNVNDITLKLIVNKHNRRIIGGQAIGTGDADKRINIVASALMGKQTLDDFLSNDLTYSPPFSPTIDPLLNAAEILAAKLKE